MSEATTRIEQRLANCLELAFPDLPPAEITNASSGTVAGWDSVATLMLVSTVEEEFGIMIGFDRVAELSSFVALRDFLEQKLAA